MVEILHKTLPYRAWEQEHTRRLPGLQPIAAGEWLIQDEVYGAQMAYREVLMRQHRDAVHQLDAAARPAAEELLDCVLDDLRDSDGFEVQPDHVLCPDGRKVAIDRTAPLLTCGALVQEDLILMEKPAQAEEHVLTGGILCFPSTWMLSQKFMKPLIRIHQPIEAYTPDVARRVQRLFDGIQVQRPIWRANYLVYHSPELFQPRSEEDQRRPPTSGPRWLRVERQGLRRLAQSQAVVFSIHTYVMSEQGLADQGVSFPAESSEI